MVLNRNPIATMTMKSGNKIVIELIPKEAPNAASCFIDLAPRTFRQTGEGVALFCLLRVGLPVVTLLCHLHLVILGPTRAKPRYFHPVPSYPLHYSWNILSHCLFG